MPTYYWGCSVLEPRELREIEEQLCLLMNERLGLSQPNLVKTVRKLGRRLPPRQANNAQVVIDAIAKADHPRLFAQISEGDIHKANARLTEYLEGIDRKKMRIDGAIRLASGLAFNLLILAAILLIVLRLRGFV